MKQADTGGITRKKINKMDRRQLARFALRPGDRELRLAAVDRLDDNVALGCLARTEEDAAVRLRAIERLDAVCNQDVLFAVASDDTADIALRLAAVGRLTTPSYLHQIIADTVTEGHVVESRAVRQMPFPDMVRQVALTAQNPAVRSAALVRILDDGLLRDIAQNDDDVWVRATAIKYVADPEARARLARQLADDRTLTEETVDRLCDELESDRDSAQRACAELWHLRDNYALPDGAQTKLIRALCAALRHPVERKFDAALVSPLGVDINGNRCAARMLAQFFADDNTAPDDRQAIQAMEGVIIAYVQRQTRTGSRLDRVLFEPRVTSGARVAT